MSEIAETTRIWLCDLTYTQQTIASDIMPAAVGCIGAYTQKHIGDGVEIRIFKFPEKLIEAIERDPAPHIVGFSHYAWNAELGRAFAAAVKRAHPTVVTVFGGPNYPTTSYEQEAYLRALPEADFYIVKEGEVAFAKLSAELMRVDFDPAAASLDLPSVHRLRPCGAFHAAETEERILDMEEIPSPYLLGMMDEFFEGRMLPIMQTNRGCPFRCTFCVEGLSYYSKVAKDKGRRKFNELEYITCKMAELHASGDSARSDLHIADSNFGMYKEDLDFCAHIAEMQRDHGYPKYVNVATGKNHKKRVLEAARMINGALRLSGSVQSLDRDVLKNIDRSNINEKEIMDLAIESSEIGANNYSEIILALPGDSKEAHFHTIQTVVEAEFNTICLYQLMLLPGTELASRESVEKWGMQTKYRALPRCYGHFDCNGEEINVAEIEEICVENESISFAQYLECRRFHLMINVFYNDGVFKEVLRLLGMLGLSKFEWLERLYKFAGNAEFEGLIQDFLGETRSELWSSRADIEAFTRDHENIRRYIDGEFGANLIFKYRSIALVHHVAALSEVACSVTEEMLADHGQENVSEFAKELILFSQLRMTDLFSQLRMTDLFRNIDITHRARFHYAVGRFFDGDELADPTAYRLPEPVEISFGHSNSQQSTLRNFLAVYGDSVAGLCRILAKVYVRKLFRSASSSATAHDFSAREEIIVQGQTSGLNEFV